MYAPMAVFRGYKSHYGAGLGNVLSGILRHAVPIFAPAIKNVGKTLVNAGANRLQHMIENTLGKPPSTTTRERSRTRKVKRPPTARRRPVKKRKRTKADIFSTR